MYIINEKLRRVPEKIKFTVLPMLVFIFSFFLATQLGKHFFFSFSYLSGIRIDYLAPTLYFTDVFSIPFIFLSIQSLFRIKHQLVLYIKNNILYFALFVLLIFINYYFSLSKELWFYTSTRIIQWLLVFYFFKQKGRNKNIYVALLSGLLCGALLELTLTLQQLSLRHSLQGVWYYFGERRFAITTPGIAKAYLFGKEFLRPYGTFSHPNSMGGFYLLIYTFVLTQKRITNQLFKSMLLILCSLLILISFSRSALVIYVILNFLYFSRSVFQCRVCTISKVAVALFLVFIAINISGDRNSFDKRTDFVYKSAQIIIKWPLSGTGAGSYLIAQHDYPQKFSSFFEQPVHNIFLLLVAQLGVPLSFLVFASIFQTMKARSTLLLFFLPFLSIVLSGIVDHYWLTLQQNMLVTAVIFGILFTYEDKKTSPRN